LARFIQSRYHIDRTYIYNAYEDGNQLYNWHALYETGDSNGIGYNNSLGGRKKPAFFAVKDLRDRFAGKVFYKAVQEDRNGVYAYIIANPDGSEPYLVFWTPQETHDYNINDLGNEIAVNWSTVFPNLGLESTTATTFALDASNGNNTFAAASGSIVAGSANLRAKRMPAFIKLVPVDNDNCDGGGGGTIKTGCGLTVEINGLNVNFVSTTNSTNLIVVVRNNNWSIVKNLCNDYNAGTDCNSNSSITLPSEGNYIVDVQIQGSEACTFPVNINSPEVGRSGSTDNDGDGICSEDDCDDTDANVGMMQTPGTLCDDGNPNTINDQIQADGCTCSGDGNIAGNCGLTVQIDGLNVNFVSTVNTTNLIIVVRTTNWQVAEYLCNDYTAGTECNGSSSVSLPFPGGYIVDLQIAGNEACTFPISIDAVSNNVINCVPELDLTGTHNNPTVYSASSTILSTAEVKANTSYYANDRISLNSGFTTNAAYNFSMGIYGCE